MSLNTDLIIAVREAQQATDRAAVELARVKNMYQMTPAGVAEQSHKLFSAARETADAAKERGLAAIDNAIAALNQQEQAESARRAADLEYMQRLESKLRIAQNMGEMTDKDSDRDRLKILFSEFAGDPLAVAVIRQTLGAEKSFFFLPEDQTGNRQQHLETAVKKLFERAMNEAGADPASYSAGADARAAEVNAFVEYCKKQSTDFSRPDSEVWQEIREQRAKDGTAAAVRFDMAMMSL